MKKRFALIVAAGLVAVLIAASAALSLGLLGASPAAGGDEAAPRVRTIHHTITVHRTAQPKKPRTVIVAAGAPRVSAGSGGGSESEFEVEDGSGGHGDEGGGFGDD
jgi:hypothetical protein